MKIAVLTLPLGMNYGGILQNYALQETLRRMGHDTVTIDFTHYSFYRHWRSRLWSSFKHFVLLRKNVPLKPGFKQYDILTRHTSDFIANNIERVSAKSKKELRSFLDKGYDAFIVGSDQVWRPRYSPSVMSYYLDFIQGSYDIKRIAYGVSFGVNDWEYGKRLTDKCRREARKFDHVSVRETSGVVLCREKLDVDACCVPDPVLLFNSEDYIRLINSVSQKQRNVNVLKYILDQASDKDEITKLASAASGCSVKDISPFRLNFRNRKNIEKGSLLPVEEWLSAFYNAKFVVTDSFHGCVLSLVFRKPFIAIGNPERGNARISSLLVSFGLEERFLLSSGEASENMFKDDIDWAKVEEKRLELQKEGLSFINNALNEQ